MAAGFSLAPARLEEFHAFLNERLAAAACCRRAADLAVEGTLAVPGATTELAQHLARLAPFGAGNEEPILVLQRARVLRADRVGREGTAIRAFVEGEGGGPRLKAMLFRARDGALAEALLRRQRDAAAPGRASARRGMERRGQPRLHHRRRWRRLDPEVCPRYAPCAWAAPRAAPCCPVRLEAQDTSLSRW